MNLEKLKSIESQLLSI